MAKISYNNKSQTAGYDASKWNAQDANQVKESVNALYDLLSNQDIKKTVYQLPLPLSFNSTGMKEFIQETFPMELKDRYNIFLSGTTSSPNDYMEIRLGLNNETEDLSILNFSNNNNTSEVIAYIVNISLYKLSNNAISVSATCTLGSTATSEGSYTQIMNNSMPAEVGEFSEIVLKVNGYVHEAFKFGLDDAYVTYVKQSENN